MKKLICFDLDGTLTQHRSPLPAESRVLLDKLQEKYKIIMVGAGAAQRIYTQMGEYPIDIIANYGMEESKIIDGKLVVVRQITTTPDKEYFLDFGEGGGDSHVRLGGLDYVEITDYKTVAEKLQFLLD